MKLFNFGLFCIATGFLLLGSSWVCTAGNTFPAQLKNQFRPSIRHGTASPSQLKLVLKQLKVGNNRVEMNGLKLGDRVTAWLQIENSGTTTERVRVYYMVGRNPMRDNSGVINVAAGRVQDVLLNVTLPRSSQSSDTNIHSSKKDGIMWWTPAFEIRRENGAPFSDATASNNHVGPSDSFRVPISPRVDLAVVSIERTKLTETWHGGGSLEEGTMHPVSLTAVVKVKNQSSLNSRSTAMTVTAVSTRSGAAEYQQSKGFEEHRVGSCSTWPGCPMVRTIRIPPLRPGETRAFNVDYSPVPHTIGRAKHNKGGKFAAGPYVCGRGKYVVPSAATLTVHISGAGEEQAFERNNTLIQEGKFQQTPMGSDTVYCGFEPALVRNYHP